MQEIRIIFFFCIRIVYNIKQKKVVEKEKVVPIVNRYINIRYEDTKNWSANIGFWM